ncbi:hypothetical protein PV327_003035 [Microctonus hyperodae]|uniref:Pre-mRNA-splicing factor Syf1-like N-terminal HAT-repeats domain-containing protein n=1 Tax=Microctonus hyperodae TaxID=165561 RepID=A0AA39G362_MICHY|nr:hypothetical protein PV327_003035 [Microctonus hyperodae]
MEEKNVRPLPTIKYSDVELLLEYDRKRNEFEVEIKRNPSRMSTWVKYADWEEERKFISRAREIYERALSMDYSKISLWLRYVDMEIRNNQTYHARKLLDRAVTMSPHVNEFWYKYVGMEQELENDDNTSEVFERWMKWEPEEHAWYAYIKFESRPHSKDVIRDIYERLLVVHPNAENWIKYAQFEASCEHPKQARNVYKNAIDFFHRDDDNKSKLYIAFAQFEEQRGNLSRACYIYEYGLKHTAKEHSEELSKAYELHKKRCSDRSVSRTLAKERINRKNVLKDLVQKFPYQYAYWVDYIDIIQNEGNHEETRRIYEEALQNKPASPDDIDNWRVYMYIWMYYASFEELDTKDINRSRELHKSCLNVIPDQMILFTNVWLYYAEFELRQKNFSAAREALGCSMGIFSCKKMTEKYQRMKLESEKQNKHHIKDESSLNESIICLVSNDNICDLLVRPRAA